MRMYERKYSIPDIPTYYYIHAGQLKIRRVTVFIRFFLEDVLQRGDSPTRKERKRGG